MSFIMYVSASPSLYGPASCCHWSDHLDTAGEVINIQHRNMSLAHSKSGVSMELCDWLLGDQVSPLSVWGDASILWQPTCVCGRYDNTPVFPLWGGSCWCRVLAPAFHGLESLFSTHTHTNLHSDAHIQAYTHTGTYIGTNIRSSASTHTHTHTHRQTQTSL